MIIIIKETLSFSLMNCAVLFQESRCPWCDRESNGLKLCSSKPVSAQVALIVCVFVCVFVLLCACSAQHQSAIYIIKLNQESLVSMQWSISVLQSLPLPNQPCFSTFLRHSSSDASWSLSVTLFLLWSIMEANLSSQATFFPFLRACLCYSPTQFHYIDSISTGTNVICKSFNLKYQNGRL